ncbi:MAG TPA: DUF177 domain-containing protein [Gemmatimonadales bacterium]|jgi:uncharacterized protein|nr:DUF177 domain-containing protein [Gemmatimonadales bacterium]
MLRVDLRELALGPVDTRGELDLTDPRLEGLDVALGAPVRVGGRLQATGEGRFYWHGTLTTVVAGECRRCLAPVAVPVAADIGALFTQDPEALEDPDSYPLAPDATEVDLAPAIREELILAVPRYVLCREDCRGLCPRCGQDLNAGPCGCAPAADPRWQALASLKGKLRD